MKRYQISVVIEKDADGYFAFCPELQGCQGCYTQGNSYEEVLDNIRDAVRLHIEDRVADIEDLNLASNGFAQSFVRSPPEEPDLNEAECLQAAAANPAFDSLKDPGEDVYTLSDGEPFDDL